MTADPMVATQSLRTQRAPALKGRVRVAGDPAIGALALVLGAMALGETRLAGLSRRGPIRAVADALRALGARIDDTEDTLVLSGLGAGGLLAPRAALRLAEAGMAAPLLLGAAGIYPFATECAPAHPPTPDVAAALDALGIVHLGDAQGLMLYGPRMPVPGPYNAPTAAAADAVLMAGVSIPGIVSATGVPPGPDHTVTMLRLFGASVEVGEEAGGGRTIALAGLPALAGLSGAIPGDPAEAALWLVAGAIVPGSELVVENVLLNPWRAVLVQVLLDMGADIRAVRQEQALGEDVAALAIHQRPLSGTRVSAAQAALVGEALPLLVLAASFATGDTVIEGTGSADRRDWVQAMLRGLAANAVNFEAEPARLVIHGRGRLTGGGTVAAHPDPRLALMFVLMGLATRDPIVVAGAAAIEARYPGLFARLSALGVRLRREGGA